MTKLSRRLTLTLLVLILLVGYGLRIYQLGAAGIWGDEAWSISLALKPLSATLAPGSDTLPPLYQILLWFWVRVAGSREFGARFMSLIPGVLLIPAIYVTGRRLLSRSAGLIAALLAAVSPFMVLYSQEARMYTLVTLFCALSVYFAARLWGETARTPEPSLRQILPLAAAYLLATLAALYTHFYAIFVIAAQDVYVLWLYRRRPAWLGRWVAGQVGLALAFLAWLGPQIGYFAGRTQSRGSALGIDTLWQIVADTFTAFSLGWPALPWLAPSLILFLAAALAGLFMLSRRDPPGEGRPFAALYLLIPLILAWLGGPLMLFFHPRYLMVALPAYLILVAAGLAALGESRRWPGWSGWPVAALALAGIVAVSGVALGHVYTDPIYAKSGYREMMDAIRRQSRPGDALFLLNPEQEALFDFYGDKSLPKLVFPPSGSWAGQQNQARLAKVAREDKRIWLVMFGSARDWDPGGELQGWLTGHAFRAWRGALIDTQVELYVVGQVEPAPIPPVDYGGLIRLEGYGVSAQSLAAGDTLQIALAWAAGARMDRDYTIFTHLIDDQGKVIGQFDGPPMGGAHPTSAWEPGEKNVDRFGILLDPATQPGAYWLEVGWYDLATLTRIPVLDAQGDKIDDRALLVRIEVK